MRSYIINRIVGIIPVVFIASIVIFFIIHIIPGDPVYTLLPPNPRQEQIDSVREHYGFDKPIYEQYLIWANNVLKGDFGVSISTGWEVKKILSLKIGVTFQLAITVFIFAVLIAVPLGIRTGLHPNGFLNTNFMNFYTAFGFAVPSFWLGIMLIIIFAVNLRILPTSGFKSYLDSPLQALRYLILPALTQGIPISVIFASFISSSVKEVRSKEYITAAIAKGVPWRSVIYKHILKNALIPVITVAAITFGQLMAGAVITESIFGIPGLGRLLIDSITARDYAVLQADLLILVLVFISANFLSDLINAWLDPRIRYN